MHNFLTKVEFFHIYVATFEKMVFTWLQQISIWFHLGQIWVKRES